MEEAKKEPEVAEEVIEETIETTEESMTHSDSLGNLAGALAKAQGAMSTADKANAGYGYKYADLADVLDSIRKPLSENGIAISQGISLQKGKTPTVTVDTLLMHESGEWIKNRMSSPIHQMKGLVPVQIVGAVSQYLRRYSIQSIACVATKETSDGTGKTK